MTPVWTNTSAINPTQPKAGFFHLLPLICTLTEILLKTNVVLSFLNEINNLDRKLEKNTFKKAFSNKHLKWLFKVTCESG